MLLLEAMLWMIEAKVIVAFLEKPREMVETEEKGLRWAGEDERER